MNPSLLGGIAMGLTLGLTPGPVVTETVRRGARGGLRPALSVAGGAAAGNIVVACLAAAGTGALLALPGAARALSLLGAAWIAVLGILSWREAGAPPAGSEGAKPASAGPAGLAGFLLVITNPVVWLFWAAALTAAGGRAAGAPFAAGFVLGIGTSDACVAFAGSRGGRLLGARGQRIALRACALVMLAFAALALLRAG